MRKLINLLDHEADEFCDGATCTVIGRMCALLNKYDKDELCDDVQTTQILDDFDYILIHHDSDEEFNQIHNQLNKHCDREHCKCYRRYYGRRRIVNIENNEEENKYDIVVKLMDKIHSFYQHSYDTSLRSRIDEKLTNDDVAPLNNTTINNNKFNDKQPH